MSLLMANSLEEFQDGIVAHTNSGNYGLLNDFLIKSSDWMSRNVNILDQVLHAISAHDHSIGVLAILKLKLQRVKSTELLMDKEFLKQLLGFSSICDGLQIRNVSESFIELYRTLTDMLVECGESRLGIHALYQAICKLQENPEQITMLHAELCRLCLHAKNLKPAFKILTDATTLSNEGNISFDSKQLLLYYYYGGLLCTAAKDYSRAHYLFETAVTFPATLISHVMIAAYQKYILISLLLDAKGAPSNQPHALPRQMSQVVSRSLKPVCQPYLDIAAAYSNGNCLRLADLIKKHSEILIKDSNKGLANQVFLSLYNKNIKHLKKSYITVSPMELLQRVSLRNEEHVEFYLKEMILDDEIHATIDKNMNMIGFTKPEPKFNNAASLRHIEQRIQCTIAIEKKISTMDEELSISCQFLRKMFGPNEDDLSNQKMSSNFSMAMP